MDGSLPSALRSIDAGFMLAPPWEVANSKESEVLKRNLFGLSLRVARVAELS